MLPTGYTWEGLFISWFPMLLLIAVWVFFIQRMRKGKFWYAPQSEQAEAIKAIAKALERIAAALEKRSS